MSSDMLPIHISIYVKNKESKSHREQYKIAYEVEDNDKSLIFTPDFFPEAIHSFATDEEKIYKVTLDQLQQRRVEFFEKTACPPDISSKIDRIIQFIERNYDDYIGVTVVYRV